LGSKNPEAVIGEAVGRKQLGFIGEAGDPPDAEWLGEKGIYTGCSIS
jgi:hypothetical protein